MAELGHEASSWDTTARVRGEELGAKAEGRLLTLGTAVCTGWGALSCGLVHTPDASLRRLQPGKLSCLRQSQGDPKEDAFAAHKSVH